MFSCWISTKILVVKYKLFPTSFAQIILYIIFFMSISYYICTMAMRRFNLNSCFAHNCKVTKSLPNFSVALDHLKGYQGAGCNQGVESVSNYVRETKAAKSISAKLIFKGSRLVATVQISYSAGGTCLVALWPHVVQSVTQGAVWRLAWTGTPEHSVTALDAA